MGEEDKVMIVSTDRGKDRLHVKVRRRMKNGYAPNEYSKVVNLKDSNDLALLFEDLNVIVGAPIEKAFRIYREKKDRGFPF
jgi:hypothetical protein